MPNSRWSKFISIFDQNSAFFSLVLALMSFCAIIVSLMTLQEMQKQRELSMMPIIYPQNFESIKLKSDSICDSTVLHFFIKGIGKNNLEYKRYKEWFKLGFINVGKGSAVNLKFEWEENYDWFYNFFDTIQIDPKIMKLEKHNNKFLIKSFICTTHTSSIVDRNSTFQYSHLLPAADKKENFQIHFPSYILPLHLSYFKSMWLTHGQRKENTSSFQLKHYLNLSYESVNGKVYRKKYEVEIKLTPPIVYNISEGVYAPWENFDLNILIKELL